MVLTGVLSLREATNGREVSCSLKNAVPDRNDDGQRGSRNENRSFQVKNFGNFSGGPIPLPQCACFRASWYYILYGVGMAWVMNVAAPFPAVVAVAWKLGINSKMTDICWKLFIAYLVLGGFLVVALEWRRLKQLEAQAFLKGWGEVRAHEVVKGDSHLRNATKAEVVAKSLPEFKFFCPSCGQHIRCDAGYVDRKINCPSCKDRIVVPQPNAGSG